MGNLLRVSAFMVVSLSLGLFQNCSPYKAQLNSASSETGGGPLATVDAPPPSASERSPLVSSPILEPPYKCVDRNLVRGTNMKRLSKNQYVNTVRDLLTRLVATSSASSIFAAFQTNLNLPEDTGAQFSRTDTTLTAFHVRGYFESAVEIAAQLASDTYRSDFLRTAIALKPGGCTNLSVTDPSAVCREQLVRNLGLRILRRPLDEASTGSESLAQYLATLNQASSLALGIENLVFQMLLSPYFLNQIQNDGVAVQGNLYSLSPYSLVSKLSFALWNSMPDEGLLSLAPQLDPKNPADVEKAITYVFSKPEKLSDSIGEFFKDWLKLDRMARFADNGTEKFSKLSEGLTLDENLRHAMIEEVIELGRYVVATGGSFQDLYTNDISFARNRDLMTIYGQSVAAPAIVTSQNAVHFQPGQRSGLLTRAGFLLSDTQTANPVKRGLHLRRDILCQQTPSPPANLAAQIQAVQFEEMATTRTRYEKATAQPVCMGCHASINPVGFSMVNYNPFGKYEISEPIFSLDGADLNTTLPIDASADLSKVLGEDCVSSGPVE
ncbi:MAG: DUF1588 domain-containing protein, partial [Bdellovibrionales bacterium]